MTHDERVMKIEKRPSRHRLIYFHIENNRPMSSIMCPAVARPNINAITKTILDFLADVNQDCIF